MLRRYRRRHLEKGILPTTATSTFLRLAALAVPTLSLAATASPTFTGDVTISSTTVFAVACWDDGSTVWLAANGDIRYNSTTSSFEGYAGGAWGAIGGGATGGGSDAVFYENTLTVTTSYTITASSGAHAVGPLEIESGATVTVPANLSSLLADSWQSLLMATTALAA